MGPFVALERVGVRVEPWPSHVTNQEEDRNAQLLAADNISATAFLSSIWPLKWRVITS